MTGKDTQVDRLLAITSLKIHPNKFVLITSPISSASTVKQRLADLDNPFWSIITSEEEISLIIPATAWLLISSYLPKAKTEDDYRVITLDVAISWDSPGYLTKVLSILAQENIAVGIISGFSRHHLVMKSKHLLQAIDCLNQAIEIAQ